MESIELTAREREQEQLGESSISSLQELESSYDSNGDMEEHDRLAGMY